MIIQLCGLSGSGKTTLSEHVKAILNARNIDVEILDGDEYRKALCAGLGFTKEDRWENIRRLAFVAGKLSRYNVVAIICAINPYEAIRREIEQKYPRVKTVYINCPVDVVMQRDTKGLYKKAMLPDGHPEKINNLTGINDPFEPPASPDLIINTASEGVGASAERFARFILAHL